MPIPPLLLGVTHAVPQDIAILRRQLSKNTWFLQDTVEEEAEAGTRDQDHHL